MSLISDANLHYYLSGGGGNADPAASLGGAISATRIIGSLNNLFDDVTSDESGAGDVEYRCIYFKNVDANPMGLIDAKLWIDAQTTSPGTSISIALGSSSLNGVEPAVGDESTPPTGPVFTAPDSKLAGLTMPTPIVENDHQALWIRRTVSAGCVASASDACSVAVEGDSIP